MHKTREIDIHDSPNLGYIHGETISPSFYIIHQNKEIQPTADPL